MSKKKKKEESKALHIYRVVKNTFFGIVIAILTAFIILTMVTRLTGGTPSAFGYSMYRVSSGSMTPELQVGDVIITREFDTSTVKSGDIVTHLSRSGSMKDKLVTHRVVKGPYKKGSKTYVVTKGDANGSEDDPITIDQIKSKFVTKVSILRTIYNIFVTPVGLLIIIGLIIFAFFNEILILIKAIAGIGYEDEHKEDIEDVIERYQKENREKKIAQSDENSDDENNSGG